MGRRKRLDSYSHAATLPKSGIINQRVQPAFEYFLTHEIFSVACGYLRNNETDVNLLLAFMLIQKQHRGDIIL